MTEDVTYVASYSSVVNQYTVTFVNDDGTVLSAVKYNYGTVASDIVRPTPSKAATAQYTYTFSGWNTQIVDVTEDVTYVATYDAVLIPVTAYYVMTYEAHDDSDSMRTYTISIERTSGTSNISNARLLIIANYNGAYINVYSKIDLSENGSGTELIRLSTTGLTGLKIDIVEGFPQGAYSNYGTLTPSLI